MTSWRCPYCNQPQPITKPNHHNIRGAIQVDSLYGDIGYAIEVTSCANKQCKEVSLKLWFGKGKYISNGYGTSFQFTDTKTVEFFSLRPSSSAKPQPTCVPKALAEDYYEACKIRDLSPKSSATLARRALQGMIRDFAGIKKKTLFDEIEALEAQSRDGTAPAGVNEETIAAMHSLRKVGNIGAHMKGDIDSIVDVDPNEAQCLIDLIEMLFEEWYVAREVRRQKLAKIQAIAKNKDNPSGAVPQEQGPPANDDE